MGKVGFITTGRYGFISADYIVDSLGVSAEAVPTFQTSHFSCSSSQTLLTVAGSSHLTVELIKNIINKTVKSLE